MDFFNFKKKKSSLFRKFTAKKKHPSLEFGTQNICHVDCHLQQKCIQVGEPIETLNVSASIQTCSRSNLNSEFPVNNNRIDPKDQIIGSDGNTVILHTSRSKSVNTVENPSILFVGPCIECNTPVSSDIAKCEPTLSFIVTESFHVSPKIADESGPDGVIGARSSLQECEQTCPQFAAYRVGEIDGALTGIAETAKLEGTNNNRNQTVDPTNSVVVEEERKTDEQQSFMVNGTETETSTQTRLNSIEEGVEELEESSEAYILPQQEIEDEVKEEEQKDETELHDIEMSTEKGEGAEDEIEEELINKEESRYQQTDEIYTSIDESASYTDQMTTDGLDKPLSLEAVSRHEKGTMKSSIEDKDSEVLRMPSMYRLQTQTMSRSVLWGSRRSSWRNCRVDSACASEGPYCGTKTSESLVHCSRIGSSIIDHFGQCETIKSDVRCANRDKCPTMKRLICDREYLQNVDHCGTCDLCSRNWRNSDGISMRQGESNEYWSKDHCKTDPSLVSFREPFMHHQFCRKNNFHGHSITREALENCMQNRSDRNNAWNQYYLNFDRSVGGRYCLCNNRYNICRTNMFYPAAGNQMIWHTPTRQCYSFAWC